MVTDANVASGYLPPDSKLGGDMTINRALAFSLEMRAEGIVNIVNENMCGALRLASVAGRNSFRRSTSC